MPVGLAASKTKVFADFRDRTSGVASKELYDSHKHFEVDMKETYTHEEVLGICRSARLRLIQEFECMVDDLQVDVSGECVWLDELREGIEDITRWAEKRTGN